MSRCIVVKSEFPAAPTLLVIRQKVSPSIRCGSIQSLDNFVWSSPFDLFGKLLLFQHDKAILTWKTMSCQIQFPSWNILFIFLFLDPDTLVTTREMTSKSTILWSDYTFDWFSPWIILGPAYNVSLYITWGSLIEQDRFSSGSYKILLMELVRDGAAVNIIIDKYSTYSLKSLSIHFLKRFGNWHCQMQTPTDTTCRL